LLTVKLSVIVGSGCSGLYAVLNLPWDYQVAGDGVEIARRHNIELKNLDYVQIHPTPLYSDQKKEAFLFLNL
ncbi:MAG: hypothetical protein ACOCN3_14855, partial [Roseburia inulinivorans]